MKTTLLIIAIAFSAYSVSAQFTVKINFSIADQPLQNTVTSSFTREFKAMKDVGLTNTARFEIKVDALKRKVRGNTFDYFMTIVATANTSCVVERDSTGRVVSTMKCKELLSVNSYVGRKAEIIEL